MDSVNYKLDVQNPLVSSLQGFSAATSISEGMRKQQEAKLAMEQQKMIADAGRALMNNPNPTAADYAKYSMLLPDKQAAAVRAAWDMMDKDKQQQALKISGEVYSAFNSGNNEMGVALLKKQSEALHNTPGQEAQADYFDRWAQIAEINPNAAKMNFGTTLSLFPGGDKVIDSVAAMGKEQRAQELQPGAIAKNKADIDNINSQIDERAGRLALDKKKLNTDTWLKLQELAQKRNPALSLGDDARKIINTASSASVASDMSADQMNSLASKFEATGGGQGKFSGINEYAKSITGSQDYLTTLRQEYVRIRASQVMKMLPPGSASDADVNNALKGFPPETADAKFLASFLRGVAKLEKMNASVEDAKSEWVNSVGHLGKPTTDIVINGVTVPAGTTFSAFTKQYLSGQLAKPSGGANAPAAPFAPAASKNITVDY